MPEALSLCTGLPRLTSKVTPIFDRDGRRFGTGFPGELEETAPEAQIAQIYSGSLGIIGGGTDLDAKGRIDDYDLALYYIAMYFPSMWFRLNG